MVSALARLGHWPGRLLLPAALVVLLGGAVPSADVPREQIGAIESYLNGLGSLKSAFVQIAPDGTRSTGTLYYKRPDKMRLDYDPPSQIEIIANGWEVMYHDKRLKQVSEMLTSQTPLAFLLADTIKLEGDVTVTDFQDTGSEIKATLVESDEPGQGRVTLTLAQAPLALRGWSVTDAQGQTTHVILEDVQTGVQLDDELFSSRDPYRGPESR